MTYILFTLSMLWFNESEHFDKGKCQLSAVECPHEQPAYIQEYIKDEFNNNGLDGDMAVRIVACESMFRANAISPTDDYGYFQWNKYWWPDIVKECFGQRDQLACETKYAIAKVKRDGNWSAWSCSKKIK